MNSNYHQQPSNVMSVYSVSPSISPRRRSLDQQHPEVQKLYEQQQQLLNKLQLLEKDDPNPQSTKLWGIMQRIFTEENAQQRQQNIEDLTTTLDAKHRDLGNENNDESLLKSIHEITKETVSELKEMRIQLNEERKINSELRRKMRRKNRQLKVLSQSNKITEDDDQYVPLNERRHLSIGSTVDTDYSLNEEKQSSFQKWCANM